MAHHEDGLVRHRRPQLDALPTRLGSKKRTELRHGLPQVELVPRVRRRNRLGEDLGKLLTAAERGVALLPTAGASGSITLDIAEVMAATDPRLAPVKRWFELRTNSASSAMTLDDGAIAALASLMSVSALECRRILISTIRGVRHTPAPGPAPLTR